MIVGNVVRPTYEEAVYLVEESDILHEFSVTWSGVSNETYNIVVAGTHGKTSTTSIGAPTRVSRCGLDSDRRSCLNFDTASRQNRW